MRYRERIKSCLARKVILIYDIENEVTNHNHVTYSPLIGPRVSAVLQSRYLGDSCDPTCENASETMHFSYHGQEEAYSVRVYVM